MIFYNSTGVSHIDTCIFYWNKVFSFSMPCMLTLVAESPGLKAIAEGFRYLGLKDDHKVLENKFIVYDALYAYCRQKVMEGQK